MTTRTKGERNSKLGMFLLLLLFFWLEIYC